MRSRTPAFLLAWALLQAGAAAHPVAAYLNFESSHVHPVALTPGGGRLLAVNTPDARLEIFTVLPSGDLALESSVAVGLEPVTVAARTASEAWVVNHLSDSISIVDLDGGAVTGTLATGDEPSDVVFAAGRAFVAVSQEDSVEVFDLANLSAPPLKLDIFSSDTRALAVAPGGDAVYAVPLHSGNRTTVVNANIIANNNAGHDPNRLAQLGLNPMICNGAPPPYPPLPAGIQRNPLLADPSPPDQPPVGLIVQWDEASGRWEDEAGQDWTHCLPFRLPDHDLFIIDPNNPLAAPLAVDHLGTTLFDVSVNPANGRIYVPHTEARNMVRFEHPLGVRGHVVDNRMAIVEPSPGHPVTIVDLNEHIDRSSDPAANLSERQASISQPGMMVWNGAGSLAYVSSIGSRKVFRLDGSCLAGSCIFGPTRSSPDAVVVGEGPTGLALHEGRDRLYVLNRFSNSIALVEASSMTKIGEIPLHDPSSPVVRDGRRLLYDAIDTSGHGDAACSSCHVSGNLDELAWDLGDPEGDAVPYGTPGDNVRFIVPQGNAPVECPPAVCAAHDGFDPQKGPMTTQTLRGMVEPLHWRGDRATMNEFNAAFVSLLGKQDIGPINGKPAGLPAPDMEMFRQFALGIAFPPNPYRTLDDREPNQIVSVPGHQQPGNPAAGRQIFLTGQVDAGQSCSSCHALPFGTAGGKLGGIEPGDPSTDRAALFNGTPDGSPHSDLKVPHTRNLYEKFGPRFGSHADPNDGPADQKSGFGFTHDGSIPDLGTFFSAAVFTMTPQQVRDVSMFQILFPTGTRPAVGFNLTVAGGPPPTGAPPQEDALARLIDNPDPNAVSLGNPADPLHHCDLVVSVPSGAATRSYALAGGLGAGGLWTTDVDGEPPLSTLALRSGASAPLTFLCGTAGSGVRLGVDRDEDGHFNGSDCSDGDPDHFAAPEEVAGVEAGLSGPLLSWADQSAPVGPALFYEVAGGTLSGMASQGLEAATACLAGNISAAGFDDPRPDPPPGDGFYYVVRARTPECSGGFSPARAALETIDCTGF